MKRTLTLFACVIFCCAMMVSCKNAKTAEPTPEEVQARKVALADSVLAEIDAIADGFIDASSHSFDLGFFELTEAEKLVKPDYLLEPKEADRFVTKSQKINALAIYIVDLSISKMYDMPMEEAKEVIAKLAIELNHPIDVNGISNFDMPASEKIKKEYEACRERGDLAYFWQFHNAIIAEISYIFAQNPELFFSKITEEQWQQYIRRTIEKNMAMRELAKYDEEMTNVLKFFNQTRTFSSDEEAAKIGASIESAKQYRITNKDKYISKRNALLK